MLIFEPATRDRDTEINDKNRLQPTQKPKDVGGRKGKEGRKGGQQRGKEGGMREEKKEKGETKEKRG